MIFSHRQDNNFLYCHVVMIEQAMTIFGQEKLVADHYARCTVDRFLGKRAKLDLLWEISRNMNYSHIKLQYFFLER